VPIPGIEPSDVVMVKQLERQILGSSRKGFSYDAGRKLLHFKKGEPLNQKIAEVRWRDMDTYSQ
jgi:hypothetical protein